MSVIVAIISILLGSVAQFFLKKGTMDICMSTDNIAKVIADVVSNHNIWIGIFCYVLSLIFWIFVLSKMQLGRAYPMVSMGYVFTLLLSHYLLNEEITQMKVCGICAIIVGVICLFFSKS